MRRLFLAALIGLSLIGGYLIGASSSVLPALAQPGEQCFQETGKCVRGTFLRYWQRSGGLRQQGLPISDEMRERQAPPPVGDGNEYTVQYFERARFEYHPEFAGTENEVLLGLLGSEQYQAKYVRPGAPQPPPPPIDAEAPIVQEGRGDINTRPFGLRGGNYTVQWRLRTDSRFGCVFGGSLRSVDGSSAQTFGTNSNGPGTSTGESQLYNVKSGQYYLRVIATDTCNWTVTFTPQT